MEQQIAEKRKQLEERVVADEGVAALSAERNRLYSTLAVTGERRRLILNEVQAARLNSAGATSQVD